MGKIKIKTITQREPPCPQPAPKPSRPQMRPPTDPPPVCPPPPPFMPPSPCCPGTTVVLNNTVVRSIDGAIDVKEGYDHGRPAFFLTVKAENIPPFVGATDERDGKAGAVPAPVLGDQNKFLKGDGTWSEVVTPEQQQSDWAETDDSLPTFIQNKPGDFGGATESDDGSYGFVPTPKSGEQDTYLRGDGNWTAFDQSVDAASGNAVTGKAVAAELSSLNVKIDTLFDSITPVPTSEAGDIVNPLEPGDGEPEIPFD